MIVITQVSDVDSVPPANLNLSGVVLAPDGKPAQGVIVLNDSNGGNSPVRQQSVTDENGQFRFSDAGQIIRIEMPEYRSFGRIVSAGESPVRIRLEGANASDWVIPACSENPTKSRVGFKALISVPPSMSAEYYRDDDQQGHFVYPKESSAPEAELIVAHQSEDIGDNGAGSDSKWFSQRWIKDSSGHILGVDARGRSRDGTYYRAATFGQHDTVGYSLHREKENPGGLNKIIDGLCTATN